MANSLSHYCGISSGQYTRKQKHTEAQCTIMLEMCPFYIKDTL